ncbi:MAG: endonuclease/exonuclease/phosphatase family protein, partial [Cyanobacteria bacterium P01_H01_bin.15]
VDTAPPYPVDTEENTNTNFPRKKPYDAIYVNSALEALEAPVVIGDNMLNHGLVFDSRNFSPLSAVTPVRKGDSNGPSMQHMAVIRDFDF